MAMAPGEFLNLLLESSPLITLRMLEPVDTPIIFSKRTSMSLAKLPKAKVQGKNVVVEDVATEVVLPLIGAGEDYVGWFQGRTWEEALQFIKNYPKFKILRLSFQMVNTGDSPHSGINFYVLDQILEKVQDAGLYVILDCHHYIIPMTWQNFWIAQWREFAHHYRKATVILGYELCNEPMHPKIPHPQRFYVDAYQKCANAIRQIDPEHPVIIQIEPGRIPPENVPELIEKIPNTIYTFHLWSHAKDKNNMQVDLDKQFGYYSAIQERFNVPLWLGEYGIYFEDDLDSQSFWMKTATEMAKSKGWGYCMWMLNQKLLLPYWDFLFK